jgi:muramoyltetrapeptide carboxypeptidase
VSRTARRLRLPPALPRGGTIGVVAPSSPIDPDRLERGVARLRAEGFSVVHGAHVLDRRGHLAGRDEDRAADLHAMFTRPDVHAVLCARGGAGAIRLLPHLDWGLLRKNPRPFLGYSDVTVLHLALWKRCRMPVFFAPMISSELARGVSAACLQHLWRQVCEPEAAGTLDDPRCEDAVALVPGVAEGPCLGGTLSLLVALAGTPYFPDLRGAVLFFEDVDETPSHVERFLCQLREIGALEEVAGFLIGETRWDAEEAERAKRLSFAEVYQDLLAPLKRPVVYRMPVGHLPDPLTLPLGVRIRLDAGARRVAVLDAAVSHRSAR